MLKHYGKLCFTVYMLRILHLLYNILNLTHGLSMLGIIFLMSLFVFIYFYFNSVGLTFVLNPLRLI